jgi:LysM repeat protein
MNKKSWTLFGAMILIILILSGTSSFFYFKSRSGSGTEAQTSSSAAATSDQATPTPATSASPQSTSKPSTPSNRPSNPTDTVVIQSGETLFAIATKNGITWTDLAAANGITDANKIQAGQSLIIPKSGQINYTVDSAKVTSLAKSVAAGQYAFRLDPTETAKADCNPAYGLTTTDTFAIKNKDDKAGTATVLATKDTTKYLITLTQPDVKGATGIWAITSIAPQK